ncbi:von Willebrand factor A domain-containing protein 5A [Phlyctema vagabunda]|uniref:von Willebrand factor A domain-containing protein 5A n=1 Tax=Phlyctema vagabunda TaxID=108571 RepID=A0ABR4PWL6_9HELO
MALCGCFFKVTPFDAHGPETRCLPLVASDVHSTILSTTTRTVLKQKFVNPSSTNPIKECRYMFPLFDGVSIVSFTCHIGEKTLKGIVKERQKAKNIFAEAVSRGETAGLLEQSLQASDVFSTKLGNIPAATNISVEIVYIGELKQDAEEDGVRFTIPTKIVPRYGSGPQGQLYTGDLPVQDDGGMRITVDISMPDGSFIQGIQSPSHPIAVSMGHISTTIAENPSLTKGSATLSLGSTALDKDFVVVVLAKDTARPQAILETHPTVPNHRALMVTLVPKFSLPATRPEIVFVADRSGSMGDNISMLITAMKVFLKSLPIGIKFNICSFGSTCSFLWSKSKPYTAKTLAEATQHVEIFSADMGGTEIFSALKNTIENRYPDLPLEIILLTDGDIWAQEELFAYINEEVNRTSGNIRIFPMGIGSGVSHALIEGLARAGNGFAQSIQSGERLDKRVVKMLRGALSPHINDYSLEVNYEGENDTDEGFELVDKVVDGMDVLVIDHQKGNDAGKGPKPETKKPAISLFDSNANPEEEDLKGINKDLPIVPYPKLLQSPQKIPTLYAFSRTVVYLLMSSSSTQKTPKSVTLRATSKHGPLELEIPIDKLPNPGETIHQLAARKATQDYEEGRGWIFDAVINGDSTPHVSIKDKYPSQFDSLVEQEAVRLGEQFQVAGKWTSFVAVNSSTNEGEVENEDPAECYATILSDEREEAIGMYQPESSHRLAKLVKTGPWTGASGSALLASQPSHSAAYSPTEAFSASVDTAIGYGGNSFRGGRGGGGGGRGGRGGSVWGGRGGGIWGGRGGLPRQAGGGGTAYAAQAHSFESPTEPADQVLALIDQQSFSGSWDLSQKTEILKIIDVHISKQQQVDSDHLLTMLVVVFLETKKKDESGVWGLVVQKARDWLSWEAGVDMQALERSALAILK